MTLMKSNKPLKTASQEVREARFNALSEYTSWHLVDHLIRRHRVGLLMTGYLPIAVGLFLLGMLYGR